MITSWDGSNAQTGENHAFCEAYGVCQRANMPSSTKLSRISLSAESLGKPFITGRDGNLPYGGVCNMETGSTSLSRISLSAKSFGKPFTFGRYRNLPYAGVCNMNTIYLNP